MHFLRVNVTFYSAVNMIHDFIKTAYIFPYTTKFVFAGVKNNNKKKKTLQIKR